MSSEIGVKLTGDNSEFKSMLSQSVEEGKKFAGELTAKTADKFLGLRDVSHAVATALGLNLENIAEHLARAYTGMSKAEEEAYKASAESSDKATELSIKNARSVLTEEQKYQLAIQTRDKLLNALSTTIIKTGVDQEKYNQKNIEYQTVLAETIEYEIKQREKAAQASDKYIKARIDASNAEFKASIESLSVEEKVDAIKTSIAAKQAIISMGVLDANTKEVQGGILAERKVMLLQIENDLVKDHIQTEDKISSLKYDQLTTEQKIAATQKDSITIGSEIRKQRMDGSVDAGLELSQLQTKNELAKLFTQRAEEEKKVTEQKNEALNKQVEIQAILSKGIGNLTDDDRARLVVLAGQNGVLMEQISIINDLTKQFEGFTATITRTGSDYQSQSTSALQGVLAKLQAQINPLGNLPGASSGSVGNNLNYGAYLNNAAIQPEIQAVQKELALRLQIKNYAAQYGTNAATYQFGDADTQRALRDQTTEITNLKNSVNMISGQLSSSGLFPVNSPAPR